MTTSLVDPHPAPGGRGQSVREHVAAVAGDLTERLGEMTIGMRDLLAGRIAELDVDPALLSLMGASIEGNVVNILRGLEHDIECSHQEAPTAAVEYARRLAQRGVPVHALVRAYRLGQQFLLRQAFVTSYRVGGGDEVRAEAFAVLVDSVFDYIDWISQRVVVVYEEERESWLVNQSNARSTKVRQVLEGEVTDVAAAEEVIGYRLGGRHLAVVAWMPETSHDIDRLTRATRQIKALAAAVGSGGAPLVVGCDRATAWGWIPVPGDWAWDPALARWRSGDACAPVLALGGAHRGPDGFRRSHEQAQQVHRLAALGGAQERALISHDEPGIAETVLLTSDLDAARSWVHAVLGDLAQDEEAAARMRRTLLTFLRHDMSYTATAAAMMMHKNSIKYRLTSAESVLGHPVAERRLAVELALNACEWLGPAVLRAVAP